MNSPVSDKKLKCVTFMVFEEKGKTILQPIIRGQDMQSIHELFLKNALEVWLTNDQPDFDQFDLGILKYNQVAQSSNLCTKTKNRERLKNRFEAVVSCEQCPQANEELQTVKGSARLPNLSFRLRRLGRCSPQMDKI